MPAVSASANCGVRSKAMSAAEVVTYLGGKQHVNVVDNTIAGCEYCE